MFSEQEKSLMLAVKGVGPTVISRLEQIGFSSLPQLAAAETEQVTKQIAQMMGSTCWHNSPQARAAVEGVIELARREGEASR
ncbi:hypothetical protein SOASR030_30430 [Leminorella grimontii]|uniref:Helix-hairpin-helix domain-containing protein n=1 Tax=Leminorella grimontii TaxID=82981 RepID=A0AAV5N4B2_9GAMM|nr:helix-hairpin-helix domain-containing protein [Leminorella grimontii]KFC94965.1 hypothetical protein GLGR_2397 [Leminorella grimontii ATCC 33999 = DSM 5078]GKX56931.1 hypothetical protein SOASR030_30430 [Leminorella grimontii]VFS61181.1 Uncharacterised protein [Leminorella grimontii]